MYVKTIISDGTKGKQGMENAPKTRKKELHDMTYRHNNNKINKRNL